jgi:hypothetical protein
MKGYRADLKLFLEVFIYGICELLSYIRLTNILYDKDNQRLVLVTFYHLLLSLLWLRCKLLFN